MALNVQSCSTFLNAYSSEYYSLRRTEGCVYVALPQCGCMVEAGSRKSLLCCLCLHPFIVLCYHGAHKCVHILQLKVEPRRRLARAGAGS